MKTLALLIGISLASTLCTGQTMYKWVDKDGKTHYTDSPPPEDAKKLAAPKSGGAGAAPRNADGKPGRAQGSFGPEEEAALAMVCAISIGVKKLARDPRSDPNYQYRWEARDGGDMVVWATPSRPGLTGFFADREIHYNPGGAAGKADPRIVGGISCLAAMG